MPMIDPRRESAVRRWRGAGFGTAVMQLSYIPLVLAWRAAIGGADVDSVLLGQALGFGLGVMPIVFIVVAFVSRHRQAPTAVLKAMVLFVVVGGPLFVVIDPMLGTVAGYAAGGVVALRQDFGPRATQARIVAVIAVIVAVLLLMGIFAPLAAAVGALSPFLALAYADHRVVMGIPVDDDDEETLLEE